MIDDTGARNGGSTPGGSEPATSVSFSATVCLRPRDVLPPIEFDPDHRHANGRRRAHTPDTDRSVEGRLNGQRYQRLDFERIHARCLDKDRDRRCRQIGQDVEWDAGRRPAAPHEKRHCQCNDDRPMRKRPTDESVNHRRTLVHMAMGRHLCRERREPNQMRTLRHDALPGLDAFEHLNRVGLRARPA